MWEVKVDVFLKNGVLDVQGRAVEQVLHSRGFTSVIGLKAGKSIAFILDVPTKEAAESLTKTIAETTLINPLIENFQYTVQPHSVKKEEVRR